jgi:hypothetical protein
MTESKFTCPICKFSCGRKKKFEEHLQEHGYASIESAFVALHLNDKLPTCACNLCGETPKFIGWNHGFSKYVSGHNGRIYSALSAEEAKRISDKRSKSLKGHVGWSSGLTKENCDALAKAAISRSNTMRTKFQSGEITSWSKGLTKETDARIATFSATLKEKFQSGEITQWSKGLTKDSDERVMKMSMKIAQIHRNKELRERLDAIKRLDPEVIQARLKANVENLELVTDLVEYTRDRHENLEFKCKICGAHQKKSLIQALSDRCDFCSPIGSKGQRELFTFVKSLGFDCKTNDRSIIAPQEIDITLSQLGLGIEYNGLYFHSEIFKSKKYHDEKSISAFDTGYRLIHIWEDEWKDKKEIVKSMIKHRCNLNETISQARKCTIVDITQNERKLFFDTNHIDGDVRASNAWGLFDLERKKIVAAISVRKPMHKKWNGSIEIARFATVLNESVPGAMGKLIKCVESFAKSNNYNSVITYADGRFGSIKSAGYEKIGYALVKYTIPRFWWTDGSMRIDRFKVKADKESDLTEKQVADSLGVVKVWGCRNLLYEKSLI